MAKIELTVPIHAPRDELWRYLSSASGLSCWQADEVTGSLQEGEFSLRWPSLGARLDLSVADVVRGERITLRAGQNALSLSITEEGVQLLHEGLEETDDLPGLRCSWRLALSLLAHAAKRHPGRTRHVEWLFQLLPMGHELAHYYFTEPAGLSSWLGIPRAAVTEGTAYHLALDHGAVDGTVLVCENGRDVALTVEQLAASVLVLRTLPAPQEGRVIALGLSSFDESTTEPLLTDLHVALARLRGVAERRGST